MPTPSEVLHQSNQRHRFQIEKLEERIAPAHVNLPAAPGHVGAVEAPSGNPHETLPAVGDDATGGAQAAARNPHFSLVFFRLPYIEQDNVFK